MSKVGVAFALFMLSSASVPAASQSADWKFAQDATSCVAGKWLSASGFRRIAIKLPIPTPRAEISILADDKMPTKGVALIDDGSTQISVPFATVSSEKGEHVAQFAVERGQWERLLAAKKVEIRGLGKQPLVFDPLALPEDISTMRECGNALLLALKLDPAIAMAAQTSAIGTSDRWISDEDAPPASGGIAVIVWTVGLDLRAHDCHVVTSQGSPVIGPLSCRLMEARGRYVRAALDERGNPVESFGIRVMQFF